MRDHEIICSWNNSLKDSIDEFIGEFKELTSQENKEGFYTFFFSRYDNYKIITEVIYVIVYKDTALFFWPFLSMVLELDNELKIVDGSVLNIDNNIMNALRETPNLEFLGFMPNDMGNCFDIFTLKDEKPKEIGTKIFKEGMINMNNIRVDETDFIDTSLQYLDYVIENFGNVVNKAMLQDEDDLQLNENPYADMYYNRDALQEILQRNKRALNEKALNDSDV